MARFFKFWREKLNQKKKEHKRPYYLASGKPNKYGVKCAMDGHKCLPNGSIIIGPTRG